ncbi:MAG TPA: CDGSH iron-sulfur domain-containing protein [Acidimicrobiales bacterium]|nr:CDGSH iron-sulfur domain-containing protein [Acidimicrobiales bacterium]
MSGPDVAVTVTANGPYVVTGGVPLARQTIVTDADGGSVSWREGEPIEVSDEYRLCRCGQSATKPFCDESHRRVRFDGTETAGHDPYLADATVQDGPIASLTDKESLCAFARFCDPGGQVWNLIEEPDEQSGALAVREAELCPSGRLVAWNRKTHDAFELDYAPSIGLIEDPAEKVSGPIWLRGGIPVVDAEGTPYETRNRVTLCRCGRSSNKPFCDGTHAAIGFRDDA